MSVPYVDGSFRIVDEKTVEFKVKNMVESGSASISPKIFFDGKDVTERAEMKIGEGSFRKVEPRMEIYTSYGDVVTIRVALEEPVKPGPHDVKIQIKVEWPLWTTFTTEFKVEG